MGGGGSLPSKTQPAFLASHLHRPLVSVGPIGGRGWVRGGGRGGGGGEVIHLAHQEIGTQPGEAAGWRGGGGGGGEAGRGGAGVGPSRPIEEHWVEGCWRGGRKGLQPAPGVWGGLVGGGGCFGWPQRAANAPRWFPPPVLPSSNTHRRINRRERGGGCDNGKQSGRGGGGKGDDTGKPPHPDVAPRPAPVNHLPPTCFDG